MQVEEQNTLPARCRVWAALILVNGKCLSLLLLPYSLRKDLSQDLALGDDWQ